MRDPLPVPFGAPAPDSRAAEWRRLALFVGFGTVIFLLAVVGAAFVPFNWPDARTRGVAAPIALHSGWNITQHLLLSPLDPSATPLVPTFPHVPTGREYSAMLAIVGIVMAATIVGILKSRAIGRSRGIAD
jgi:hypothetical protein